MRRITGACGEYKTSEIDINDLLARGVLRKLDAGGRSTSYELSDYGQEKSPN